MAVQLQGPNRGPVFPPTREHASLPLTSLAVLAFFSMLRTSRPRADIRAGRGNRHTLSPED